MSFRYFWSLFLISFCLFFCVSCTTHNSRTIIKFSTWGSESEISILNPLIDEFEKENPDIKVELIHIPQNYFQKLHLLFASNLAPDVIFVNNINGVIYADAGLFEDLTFYMEKKKFDKDDFYKNSFTSMTYKGKLYAIPRDISNLVIFYNKDIFDKCGVSYPSEHWNMDEFLQKSINIVNSKKCSQKWAIGFDKKPIFWLPFLWSNGGGILNSDLDEIIIDSPDSLEAIQFYADLKNKYGLSPSDAQKGSLSNSQLFKQQDIAMQISGRWSVPFFRENLKFNWDIAPFPSSKKGSIVDVDASGWAISSSSNKKEQAWRFIEFMASKESIKKMTESGLIIPARISVAHSDVFLNKNASPQSSKVFLDAINSGIPTPANKNYQEMIDIIDKNLEIVFNGKKSAKDVLLDKTLKNKLIKLLY